jgi:phthalate 4,5-dioxygenase oxygenase subunit
MWVTMGPITNRSSDRLGASDMAVVEFRKQMLEALNAFEQGEPAIGTGDLAIPKTVVSYQAVIPKTTDWRDYECSYIWGGDDKRPELEPSYSVKA